MIQIKQCNHYPIVLLIMCGLWGCQPHSVSQTGVNLAPVPDETQVGAKLMPDSILPVEAPFSTIEFSKPHFPVDTIILPLQERSMNTASIQRCIDSLSQTGGGVVIVPKGTWKTGRIILKDNINLHFQEGAILSFSGEVKDYLPVVPTRFEGIDVLSLGACLYANGATNIAITGKGRLIGPAQGSVRDRILTSDLIDNVIDVSQPLEKRVIDGTTTSWILPPMFISPIHCKQVYIEGVSLENTAFWNVVPVYCDGVIIRGVSVSSVGIARGDGIDVESSRNVLIEYCTLSCGDDCFTMKAGRGPDGIRVNRPTENVVVRWCLAQKGHGGITCGSETAGMIRNLYVHDCVFIDSGVGIRFKTRRPRGGGGENLNYERIRLRLRGTAFQWDMLGAVSSVGELANRLPIRAINELTPRFRNIYARDILVDSCSRFVKVVGIPESPLTNLTIENARVNCQSFFQIQDLRSATFRNIELTGCDSVLVLLDAKQVVFDHISFSSGNIPLKLKISGEASDSVIFRVCQGVKDTVWTNLRN